MSQPSNFAYGFTGGVIGCMTYQYALLKELEDEAVGLRKDFISLRRKLELAVPLLVRDDDFLKKTHLRNFGLRKPPTIMDKLQDRLKNTWNRGLIELVRMCNDAGNLLKSIDGVLPKLQLEWLSCISLLLSLPLHNTSFREFLSIYREKRFICLEFV